MAKLNDQQNIALMRNPRRIAAEKEMRKIVNHIQTSVKADSPNAEYYLTTLPPLLKKLSAAVEKLAVTEAAIETELTAQKEVTK